MLAVSEGTCCKAFTKERRKCRLERVGGLSCTVHKNYFTNWFEQHRPLGSYEMTFTDRRIYKEYKSILFDGVLNAPEKYVAEIPNDNNYVAFYLRLCADTNINPLWNRGLFKRSIRWSVDDIFNLYLTSNGEEWTQISQRIHNGFGILFTSRELIREGLKYVIFYSIEKMISLQRSFGSADEGIIILSTYMFRILFNWKHWRTMFMSADIRKLCDEITDRLATRLDRNMVEFFMNTVILVCLEENKDLWKREIRTFCNVYKEELMQETWKPDRVFKFLEMGIHIDDL